MQVHDRQTGYMQWVHHPLTALLCSWATAILPLSVSPKALHSDQDNSEQDTIAQRRMACVLPICQLIMLFAGACSPVNVIMLFAGARNPVNRSNVWLSG